MASWITWNGAEIKAKVREAERLAARDAGHVILEASKTEVPLDEATLQNSGVVFVTRPGENPPQAFITYGGGGNTGLPRIPYAVRWHETSANFQHGRKKSYLRDPFNRLAPTLYPAAVKRQLGLFGIKT